ncbi:helix-turn-helix domain-containing protein [Paraburkholderia sp. D15]|uniref:helix-turn-helix domain-containing protein n=1 Tax=Paraburkholderia sp. D15 TaxID=2880218 RepID=UPI00247A0A90|nr:helix-turn-helix domain-containing protein [Paraburkholderia sp. D15]WGS48501.1 helix-turn-helix domain-containing protein [Paraburkholderia sp. D15]WKF56375.1 Transcriptional activator FeaR [Paraburkholderia busanensis]
MSEPHPLKLRRYSTETAPAGERFDAWAARSTYCDFVTTRRSDLPFNAQREYVSIGPLVLAMRTWRHPDPDVAYEAKRTAARIRADQSDFHSFTLQMSGTAALRSDRSTSVKQPGDLYLLDFANPFDRVITPGSEISLSVPRSLLPADTERLHGTSLTHGVGVLFGDYLASLYNAVPRLTLHDVPHIVHATTQFLKTSLHPELDLLAATDTPTRDLLLRRIQRYIDDHLLQTDLTPAKICKDVGLSRAMLYRLFDSAGGVMRHIRQRRLQHIHQLLSAPDRRKERISDIARRHGFSDEKYFCRVFKAEFGHTPRETVELSGDAS